MSEIVLDSPLAPPPSLGRIAREWTRIGVIGFGGPPAHIVLLRQLVVERERWIDPHRFQDAVAATGLIPGPASTQLAIYCAGVLGGRRGALLGALGFILPGLVMVVALASILLAASPPLWVLGAGAGAGAAVPAVAIFAGSQLLGDSLRRALDRAARVRWVGWVAAGAIGAALAGALVVLVLLGCGLAELAIQRGGAGRAGKGGGGDADQPASANVAGRSRLRRSRPGRGRDGGLASFVPMWLPLGAASGWNASTLASLAWTAFKVGGLSYGGGFVIVPLMQSDAVDVHGWLTEAQFLSAVAVGQITPGPVTNTIAAVGWSAAGIPGAIIAGLFAFGPSVIVIAFAGHHFERIRDSVRARAFLDGSGPAALGAILGSAVPLAAGLSTTWQWIVLALAVPLLLSRRAPLLVVLIGAALVGVAVAAAGGTVPR